MALLLSIVALIPLLAYAVQRTAFAPRIRFRVAGEQQGEPIPVTPNGRIIFGIGTESRRRVRVTDVFALGDPAIVDLSKTKGTEVRMSIDAGFPLGIFFPGPYVITKGHHHGFYWQHESRAPAFSIKLVAEGQVEDTEVPPILDMVPTRRFRAERIVLFVVKDTGDQDIHAAGYTVGPGEALHVDGVQAQEALFAAANKENTPVRVLEVTKRE
ncbi:MAG: hypothetical protein HY556_12270 [Euryarchaeota archaeon]|nr:hypothetical protein [Euryarchaeota archaeon]